MTATSAPTTIQTKEAAQANQAKSTDRSVREGLNRLNSIGTLTFFLVNVLAWQPLREVFTDTPERATLLSRILWVTLFVTVSGAAFRAFRIPWWIGPPVSLMLIGALLRNLALSDMAITAPTAPTFSTPPTWYRYALETARESIANVDRIKSPATAMFGFAAIALSLIGLLLLVAHILSFEVEGVFESLLPPAAMLAVTSALSPGQGGAGPSRRWAILFVLAAGAHIIADADRKRRRRTRWLNLRAPSGARAVALLGAFGTLLFFGASVLSVRLGDGPLDRTVDWRTGLPKVRKVDSPTVSLRKRLVDLSNTTMFRVSSLDENGVPVRLYWRQTGLDVFDGTTWSQSARRYESLDEGDRVPKGELAATSGRVIRQTVTIDGLVDAWLPTAYRPIRLLKAPNGSKLSVDPTTGSVILAATTKRFMVYEIEARIPEMPASSTEAVDPKFQGPMTKLPSSVSNRVKNLAREIVAPAGNDRVAQAQLLQQFFQTKFEYSTDTRWSGANPLENFLFDDRIGYCEQFASAFAAMARSIGLPTRVAVGFTPGKLEADGTFLITGENAHTWPEVLIANAGWVAFEPTPGRGLSPSPTTSTTTPPSTVAPSTTPATTLAPLIPVPAPKKSTNPLAWVLIGCLLVAAGGAVALRKWLPGRMRVRRLERQRREVLLGVPDDRVDLEWAWYQLLESLDTVAATVPSLTLPAESFRSAQRTPLEVRDRATKLLRDRRRVDTSPATAREIQLLRLVADAVTESRFARPTTFSSVRANEAIEASVQLRHAITVEQSNPSNQLSNQQEQRRLENSGSST
jgi:transglutaminase-like putative cysteine protease